MKRENRLIIRFSLFAICALLLLSGCRLNYSNRFFEDQNGFGYIVNTRLKTGHIEFWDWDGNADNMVVTIPVTYGQYIINQLGGKGVSGVMTSFQIRIPTDWITTYCYTDESYYELPYELIELDFVVNIGKETTKIVGNGPYHHFENRNEDGSHTYYRVYAYVNCSEENPTFYSKDGRLYYRENDELVNAFNYR